MNFLYSQWRVFNFLNFMKMRPNMTNATFREVWQWHSTSKIWKITDAANFSCLFLFIYLFFWVGKKPNYLKIFLNITEITKFGENIKFGKGLLLSSWKGSYNENNQNVAWKVCRHLVIHRNTLTCNNICNTSKTTSYSVICDW